MRIFIGKANNMRKAELKERIRQAILAEARKKKQTEEEPEVDIDTSDIESDLRFDEEPDDFSTDTDTRVDVNMDTKLDLDASSGEAKKAFNELTDAYRAAKQLGDEKLVRQLANTITYFNKNIILNS